MRGRVFYIRGGGGGGDNRIIKVFQNMLHCSADQVQCFLNLITFLGFKTL